MGLCLKLHSPNTTDSLSAYNVDSLSTAHVGMLCPKAGEEGEVVTLIGSTLCALPADATVRFGDTPAELQLCPGIRNSSIIQVRVPSLPQEAMQRDFVEVIVEHNGRVISGEGESNTPLRFFHGLRFEKALVAMPPLDLERAKTM